MESLEKLTGFKHLVTSAYHQQSNGLDERLNQTLKAALQKLVNESQDDWDQLIDYVLFAYRTSKQDSSKFTPFFLMYGREATLPVDLNCEQPSHSTPDTRCDEVYTRLVGLADYVLPNCL